MRYYEKRVGIENHSGGYSFYYYYTFKWIGPLFRTVIRKLRILKYGFDTSDTWSLDYSMAKWLYPRLVHFKETTQSYPDRYTYNEWIELLEEICEGIELYLKNTYSCSLEDDRKGREAYKKSMQLIVDNLHDLWD